MDAGSSGLAEIFSAIAQALTSGSAISVTPGTPAG